MKRSYFLLGLVLGSSQVTAAPPPAGRVVYTQAFDGPPGTRYPEWTSSPIEYQSRADRSKRGTLPAPAVTNTASPNGKRRFLGEFGGPAIDSTAMTRVRQTIRLALTKLPPHTTVVVGFDLLILRSWDGDSPAYGPDRFTLAVAGGKTLIDATFSNNPKLDTDKSSQGFPRLGSRPKAGAAAMDRLGCGWFGDATYPLHFAFRHAADALTLEFASDLFEGKGTADEAWGLDDVMVTVGGD